MGVVDRKEDGLFDVDREHQMGCPCRRKRWMGQETTEHLGEVVVKLGGEGEKRRTAVCRSKPHMVVVKCVGMAGTRLEGGHKAEMLW